MENRHFDLCVVGSGPAGQKCAIQAAKLGKSVCVVEQMESVGGVAINTGTIPSKALREAVLNVLASRKHAEDVRSTIDRTRELALLIEYCQRVIHAEIEVVRRQLRDNGIELAHGTASFVVAGQDRDRGPALDRDRRGGQHPARARDRAGPAGAAFRSTARRSSPPTSCCSLPFLPVLADRGRRRRDRHRVRVDAVRARRARHADRDARAPARLRRPRDRRGAAVPPAPGRHDAPPRREGGRDQARARRRPARAPRASASRRRSRAARSCTPTACSTPADGRARPTRCTSPPPASSADQRGRIKVNEQLPDRGAAHLRRAAT